MVRKKRSAGSTRAPEHLRQTPAGETAQQIHLPHPLARHDIALGEQQVMETVGLDRRDRMRPVANAYRGFQPRNGQAARIDRLAALGDPHEAGGARQDGHDQDRNDEQ
jgi:hypothetical protein